MEKTREILRDVQDFFTPLGNWIIDFFALITGFSHEYSKIVLLYTLALISILLILKWIKGKIHNKMITRRKKLIEVYDKIFYLIARNEYFGNIDKEKVGGSPSVTVLQSIMKSKTNPDYFNSRELIKENIQKVETLLGATLVSNKNRSQIEKHHNTIININFLLKVLTGLQIISICAYIYFLVK